MIIKAYFFIWLDIPASKYSEKRFLNIAFVDVACIQPTIGITRMVLPDASFIRVGRNIDERNRTYQETSELYMKSGIQKLVTAGRRS